VSKVCWGACAGVGLVCAAYVWAMLFDFQHFTVLGFLYLLSYIKLLATIVK